MRYVGHQAPKTDPLRSLPLYRPAAQALGLTAQQKAEFYIKRDRTALERATTYLPIAYAILAPAFSLPRAREPTGVGGSRSP